MDSTIQSLNQVLDPVTNKTCQPTEVCGVATVTMKYGGVTGQGKIGSCVPNSFCSGTIGCQLAIKNLPSGVSSEECKVLYILDILFWFFCDCFVLIFECNFV